MEERIAPSATVDGITKINRPNLFESEFPRKRSIIKQFGRLTELPHFSRQFQRKCDRGFSKSFVFTACFLNGPK
jgi:hypothetical protein